MSYETSAAMSGFKTRPLAHQLECLNKFGARKVFALTAEQGVGKTLIIIINAAQLWASGDLNGLLVFAPNGVHYNWTLVEIPKHMPDWVRYRSAAWNAALPRKDRDAIDALFAETDAGVLRIFAMNIEALQSDSGRAMAKRFAQSCTKLMLVVDESSTVKNPKASRTKALLKLKPFSAYRRIVDGTPVIQGPFDLFSQYGFLDESILGTTSFTAFKAEYAELLDDEAAMRLTGLAEKRSAMPKGLLNQMQSNVDELLTILRGNGREELLALARGVSLALEGEDWGLVAELQQELRGMFDPNSKSMRKLHCLQLMAGTDSIIGDHLLRQQRAAYAPGRVPQIVKRNKDGRPQYRNLDKLSQLIAPHTFRVLKKDCLDLPAKIAKYVWFDMTDEQRKVYDKAANEFRLALNGEDTPFNRLVAQMKLMQITTGYYLHPDAEEPVRIPGANPKLERLVERAVATVERGEKIIIWARFKVQLADLARALRDAGLAVVEYHGDIKKQDRADAIESFERGDAEIFLGQQQAGGRGITLVAAHQVFYFSNTYGLGDRLQSEDRAHRVGQNFDVIYTDFCARDSIDYECIKAIEAKEDVARAILSPLERKRDEQRTPS